MDAMFASDRELLNTCTDRGNHSAVVCTLTLYTVEHTLEL